MGSGGTLSLQSVLKLGVGRVLLSRSAGPTPRFLLTLSDIALKALGLLKLPPNGTANFLLFGAPTAGTDPGSLGWLALYNQDKRSSRRLLSQAGRQGPARRAQVMGWCDCFQAAAPVVQQYRGAALTNNIAALAAALVGEPMIRLYVDRGGGTGQQAAAVNLLKRIIAPNVVPAGTPPGLNFQGVGKSCEIIYDDALPTTLTTLQRLLGLGGAVQGVFMNLQVDLFALSAVRPPAPARAHVRFSFSGATDPNANHPVQHDLLQRGAPAPAALHVRQARTAVDDGPAHGRPDHRARGRRGRLRAVRLLHAGAAADPAHLGRLYRGSRFASAGATHRRAAVPGGHAVRRPRRRQAIRNCSSPTASTPTAGTTTAPATPTPSAPGRPTRWCSWCWA
jgi:hypothetical protein